MYQIEQSPIEQQLQPPNSCDRHPAQVTQVTQHRL